VWYTCIRLRESPEAKGEYNMKCRNLSVTEYFDLSEVAQMVTTEMDSMVITDGNRFFVDGEKFENLKELNDYLESYVE